jgi:hypothetical protein
MIQPEHNFKHERFNPKKSKSNWFIKKTAQNPYYGLTNNKQTQNLQYVTC